MMKSFWKAPRFSLLLVVVIASLSTTGCVSSIIASVTGERIASEIRATGLPAEGTVLEIWETGTWVNHSPVVGILFEVRAHGLAPWEAQTKALISLLAIPRIQPGQVLPLKYDPHDPSRIALLQDGRHDDHSSDPSLH